MKKIILIIAGLLFLALGFVGVILPILPTTPFLLLASCCFVHSSKRLNNWFKTTNMYKNNLKMWQEEKKITKDKKIKIIISLSLIFLLAFCLVELVIVRAILLFVWLSHVVYFGLYLKTARNIV